HRTALAREPRFLPGKPIPTGRSVRLLPAEPATVSSAPEPDFRRPSSRTSRASSSTQASLEALTACGRNRWQKAAAGQLSTSRQSSRPAQVNPLECLLVKNMSKDRYQNRIELLQGTLDMLILRTLQWGPQHGHGVGQAIRHSSAELLQIERGSL